MTMNNFALKLVTLLSVTCLLPGCGCASSQPGAKTPSAKHFLTSKGRNVECNYDKEGIISRMDLKEGDGQLRLQVDIIGPLWGNHIVTVRDKSGQLLARTEVNTNLQTSSSSGQAISYSQVIVTEGAQRIVRRQWWYSSEMLVFEEKASFRNLGGVGPISLRGPDGLDLGGCVAKVNSTRQPRHAWCQEVSDAGAASRLRTKLKLAYSYLTAKRLARLVALSRLTKGVVLRVCLNSARSARLRSWMRLSRLCVPRINQDPLLRASILPGRQSGTEPTLSPAKLRWTSTGKEHS